jgi:protoporphyrinogen oxidase
MPHSHPKWGWTDEALIAEAFAAVRKLNPAITQDDLIDARAARLRYAQPVCTPGFAAILPPVETEIGGLQIADTCFYYPEDRGIAESVRFGKEMAERVGR